MHYNKPPTFRKTSLRGFSLIEVCIAMGIVTFSLLALLALVPNGLQSLQNATTEASLSSIRKEVRSELNTANFTNLSGNTANDLPQQAWYFDQSGRRLAATAPQMDRFFQLGFVASAPEIPGQVGGFEGSAQRMTMRVTYPAFAPVASQTTKIFTMLVARQASQ